MVDRVRFTAERPRWYLLDADKRPVPSDWLAYAKYQIAHGDEWRMVAKTDVGDCHVSTVFLGLDHNHLGCGARVLYETMVFGPNAE